MKAAQLHMAGSALRLVHVAVLLLMLSLLAGCGDPVGAQCDFQGSGFTASDNCRYRCLEHRTIHCPDGTVVQGPKICSGATQCDPGGCPDDQACYHVRDGFKKQSYCVPTTLCGELAPAALAQWELDSKRLSDAMVEQWERKRERMKNNPATAPAVDLPRE